MTDVKTRSRHHHGNLKQALIDYALRAADNGALESLSLRKASRDLGVSTGAAYRHFVDRDALMRTVAETGFDRLAERFETAIPFDSVAADGAEARERFDRLARAYVAFARDNPNLWRLMFGPLGLSPSSGRTDRPSTYNWLGKSLHELSRFNIIDSAGSAAQFFAWSAIHGLADLVVSSYVTDEALDGLLEKQCQFMVRAMSGAHHETPCS